MMQAAFIDSV